MVCYGMGRTLDVLYLLQSVFDPPLIDIDRGLQCFVAFGYDLLLFGIQLVPQLCKHPLNLLLIRVVGVHQLLNMAIKLVLLGNQHIDVGVDVLEEVLELGLYDGLRLLNCLHVVVPVLAYINKLLPCITHSGQIH